MCFCAMCMWFVCMMCVYLSVYVGMCNVRVYGSVCGGVYVCSGLGICEVVVYISVCGVYVYVVAWV